MRCYMGCTHLMASFSSRKSLLTVWVAETSLHPARLRSKYEPGTASDLVMTTCLMSATSSCVSSSSTFMGPLVASIFMLCLFVLSVRVAPSFQRMLSADSAQSTTDVASFSRFFYRPVNQVLRLIGSSWNGSHKVQHPKLLS